MIFRAKQHEAKQQKAAQIFKTKYCSTQKYLYFITQLLNICKRKYTSIYWFQFYGEICCFCDMHFERKKEKSFALLLSPLKYNLRICVLYFKAIAIVIDNCTS